MCEYNFRKPPIIIALISTAFCFRVAADENLGPWAAEPSKVSMPQGINDRFKDPQLDVDEWLGRFEVESREVYAARDAVMAACEIQSGESIAFRVSRDRG